MPYVPPNADLACRPDETPQEWAKRVRAERGPMPEDMQRRIHAILRRSPLHPDHIPPLDKSED